MKASRFDFMKMVSVLFIAIGILMLLAIGIGAYKLYAVQQEKAILEQKTRAYLLESYTQEDIQSIEVMSGAKGIGRPYEARVVFADEPQHRYYYEEQDDQIRQKTNPSLSSEEYRHLE